MSIIFADDEASGQLSLRGPTLPEDARPRIAACPDIAANIAARPDIV
jgi:hypothetical protein